MFAFWKNTNLLHKLFESINPCYYYILSLISNRIWYERSMNHNKYRIQAKNPSSSPLFILTLYPTMIYTFSTINELNFLSLLIHHSTATNKRKSKASYSNQLLRIIAKIFIFTGIFWFFHNTHIHDYSLLLRTKRKSWYQTWSPLLSFTRRLTYSN